MSKVLGQVPPSLCISCRAHDVGDYTLKSVVVHSRAAVCTPGASRAEGEDCGSEGDETGG